MLFILQLHNLSIGLQQSVGIDHNLLALGGVTGTVTEVILRLAVIAVEISEEIHGIVADEPVTAVAADGLSYVAVVVIVIIVEVEITPLDIIRWVQIAKRLVCRLLETLYERHGIKVGEHNAVGTRCNGLDAVDEVGFVEAGINLIDAGLFLATNDTATEDTAAISAVEKESAEAQREQVGLRLVLLNIELAMPTVHGDGRVGDEATERIGVVEHAVPEGIDAAVDIVDVYGAGIVAEEQAKRHAGAASVRLDVRAAAQVVDFKQPFDVLNNFELPTRVS